MSANEPARRSPDRTVFRFRGQYFTRADFIRMAGLSFVALLFPEKVKAFPLPNMFWKGSAAPVCSPHKLLRSIFKDYGSDALYASIEVRTAA